MYSCTISGVERNAAMYAPASHLTGLILLSRISASSNAGSTASATDTTERSRVYSTPCTKNERYFGKNEKFRKCDGGRSPKRVSHIAAVYSMA